MKVLNKIKGLMVVVLIFAVIGLSTLLYLNRESEDPVITAELVEQKLTSLSELMTLKYTYKDVVAFTDVKQFQGINIPLTKKSFIVVYEGYLKSGIDLSAVNVQVISPVQLKIQMPHSQVFDNVINEESIVIYDETSGLFNKLEYKDFVDVLIEQKATVESEAIEKGFLQEAEKNAQLLIEVLLKDLGFNEIEFVWQ